MNNIHYLNPQARLYHNALSAIHTEVVQVWASGIDGLFMTQEAYKLLKDTLTPFDLSTHQSMLWDASLVALEYPEAQIYGSMDIAPILWQYANSRGR